MATSPKTGDTKVLDIAEVLKQQNKLKPCLLKDIQKYNVASKDVVIFIGASGSGKSTILDFLNGEKLYAQGGNPHDLVNNVTIVGDKNIGNGPASETFRPEFKEFDNVLYCDMPGF
eukprot:Awhi_evm1s10014